MGDDDHKTWPDVVDKAIERVFWIAVMVFFLILCFGWPL